MEPGGRLLGNRYELLVPLASGGMGRVWRARDTVLERPVAVKVLRSEFTGDPRFRARFRAEAQHTAALHHPNIAAVHDYGELVEDGELLAYLVMELVEGETLSALIEREGRLSATRTLDLLRQASAALAVAHRAGVIHRDVKPGNVLMGSDGVVRLTDFGIALSASSVPLTRTGQVLGTAHYLSPEQAAGGKASPASDVYALGTLAYECLSGRRAFDGENSVQIALMQIRDEPDPLPADVPAALRRLVERAMAKDPAARFPDGASLHAAVESVVDPSATMPIGRPGTTATAVLPLPVLPDPEPERKRRLPVALLLGALLALVAVAVAVGLVQGDATPSADGTAVGPTTTSSVPAPPQTVDVVAGDLLGRPAEQVQAELVDRGLQVQLTPVITTERPAGRVTAVTPEGDLTPGTTVTVSYAVEPAGDGNGNGPGRGNGPDGPDGPDGPGGPGGPGNDKGNGNGRGNGDDD